jgi:hypothetical protein
MIIGCDFRPSFQQTAYVDQETGEYEERRLNHRGEAEAFDRSLAGRAVRLGVEAKGIDRWFHKLMSELGHELLVGDASVIHASHEDACAMWEPRKSQSLYSIAAYRFPVKRARTHRKAFLDEKRLRVCINRRCVGCDGV